MLAVKMDFERYFVTGRRGCMTILAFHVRRAQTTKYIHYNQLEAMMTVALTSRHSIATIITYYNQNTGICRISQLQTQTQRYNL